MLRLARLISLLVAAFFFFAWLPRARAHHGPEHGGNAAVLLRMVPGASTVTDAASLDVPAVRSAVDVTVATGDTNANVTGLRMRTLELRPAEGVRVSGLGFATEARAFDRARTRRYEVGSYAVTKDLASRWGFSLHFESAGTFSLVQSTSPEGKADTPDRPCGSQSLLSTRIAVSPAPLPRLSIGAIATLEGDPFHLVSGRACVGQPPAWLSGETFGGEVAYRGERLSVVGTVAHRTSRVSDSRGGFTTTVVAGTSLGLALRVAL